MREKLSEEDIRNIRKLRDEGATYGQIALKYGVSRQCIQQRLNYTRNRDAKRLGYKEENSKLKEELKLKDSIINELYKRLKNYEKELRI